MSIFLRLSKTYFERQLARNLAAAKQISERSAVTAGRVIPDATDLPIHAGRRLDAAVMFLDISKFSSRPSSTDAEQENLLRILSLFFTEMIRVIEDYGGYLEKNTGDGLMAYFTKEAGDTVSVQQKAVSAALTMFTAAAEIVNPLIIASNLVPIDFRICIDHGPITVAKVGAARGFNGIVAIGATANIASKMLAVADANTLLLGQSMLSGLPANWLQNWVTLKSADTGWIFTETGKPYGFWQYNGRWKVPTE
ncbi:adenylate/guanylate cyclase domain-containing protein [Rhizobium sp. Rhizsp42]|uniref:adenylate/guanylate cyclase domain-containing protein n=1 Tax=Rhizobium sp. Rhizsp42 TaxID=3243034 RepID=UPI0039AEA8AA